jgi:hypothetical protein
MASVSANRKDFRAEWAKLTTGQRVAFIGFVVVVAIVTAAIIPSAMRLGEQAVHNEIVKAP